MKRKLSSWDKIASTVDNIPNRRCLPPVIVKRDINFASTLPFYDEKGRPKKYAPVKQNCLGEWMYSLSPYKDFPPLTGIMLQLHIQSIAMSKLPLEEEVAA